MTAADTVAVVAGKLTARAIKLLGVGLGSNFPGKIARRLAPTVLSKLGKQAKLGVVAVTGTNGKSTTAGLLSSILRTGGLSLVHNKQGANLVTGITATLVQAANWKGQLNCDYCLFETDEAALPIIAREINVNHIVVTNLFRDQLDRFGELDTTSSLIEKGILQNQSTAILNADDPNVSQLAEKCRRLFFGVESIKSGASMASDLETGATKANTAELSYCKKCGGEIKYSVTFYGQLGHWSCRSCQNQRPKPTILASDVEVGAQGSKFTLSIDGRTVAVSVPLPGLFNVYNALAAAAAASYSGISPETIRQGLKRYQTLFGRSEKVTIKNKQVIIQLIKNPAGASQAVAAVVADRSARVLIAINDNLADGRDISWLWDADFDLLGGHTKKLVVSGQRADDMAVRMKYAGIGQQNVITLPRLEKALDEALSQVQDNETLWILPTYTCLLELQKILKARGCALSGT